MGFGHGELYSRAGLFVGDAVLGVLGVLSSVWSFVGELDQDSIPIVQAGGYCMDQGFRSRVRD